jgi:PPM family protein phosphatase
MTDPGQVRPHNEDNYLLLAQTGVFAVADGLGGLEAGDIASATALAHLKELTTDADCQSCSPGTGNRTPVVLQEIIATVNTRTYQHRIRLGNTMATTLAMVQLHEYGALIAHVGDSRVYLWRDAQLRQLTSDHSLVNELLDKGTLTAPAGCLLTASPCHHQGDRRCGGRLSFGDRAIPPFRRHTAAVHRRVDRDAYPMDEIARIIESGSGSLGTTIEHLVAAANRAGGHDNITALLLASRGCKRRTRSSRQKEYTAAQDEKRVFPENRDTLC